jgi:flavorubredoxin
VADLGKHKLRFLEMPHVHHWGPMMAFDETTRSLFPADLFLQPEEQPPIVREDLGKEMCQLYGATGLFASEKPVLRVVDYLATLEPHWVHPMHGGSLPADTLPGYVHALRTESFAFDGRILGRALHW